MTLRNLTGFQAYEQHRRELDRAAGLETDPRDVTDLDLARRDRIDEYAGEPPRIAVPRILPALAGDGNPGPDLPDAA